MTERKPASRVGVVAITCRKYQQYLSRLLRSLKQQTQKHDLVLVCNGDMDIDAAGAAIRASASVINIEGSTLGTAANLGIASCQADYIVRVDGDDWLEPQLLEHERKYLDTHPDVHAVYCDMAHAHMLNDSGWHQTYLVMHNEQPDLVHSCGAMYRRECWEESPYADRNHGENKDFWERFHAAGFKSKRIAIPGYVYRQHGHNMHLEPR